MPSGSERINLGSFIVGVLPVDEGKFSPTIDRRDEAIAHHAFEYGVPRPVRAIVSTLQSAGLYRDKVGGREARGRVFKGTFEGVKAHVQFFSVMAGDAIVVLGEIVNGVDSNAGQITARTMEAIRSSVTLADVVRSGAPNGIDSRIVGRWKNQYGRIYDFREDETVLTLSTGSKDDKDPIGNGTYAAQDGILEIRMNNGVRRDCDYVLDGETLRLRCGAGPETYHHLR